MAYPLSNGKQKLVFLFLVIMVRELIKDLENMKGA